MALLEVALKAALETGVGAAVAFVAFVALERPSGQALVALERPWTRRA